MELKDFVKRTILDVLDGVKEAVEDRKAQYEKTRENWGGILGREQDKYRTEGNIDFDVAVTTEETHADATNRGIKVAFNLLGANAGSEKETRSQATYANRIRFSVPVNYPRN